MQRTNIALLQPRGLLSESLLRQINAEPDMVGDLVQVPDWFERVQRSLPHVVLVACESQTLAIFDVLSRLVELSQPPRIILLAESVVEPILARAVRYGIHGCVLISEAIETLLAAIRRVASGELYFCEPARRVVQDAARTDQEPSQSATGLAELSGSQLDVLRLLSLGLSVKEVAKTLGVSAKSIDGHKYRIMGKLGIHDRVELTRFSIRQGLVSP